MTNRELLSNEGYENAIVFENPCYDDAIIGMSTDGKVVYDYDKMIEHLVVSDCMSAEEAADFISYNTIRTLPYIGPDAPIIMFDIEGWR